MTNISTRPGAKTERVRLRLDHQSGTWLLTGGQGPALRFKRSAYEQAEAEAFRRARFRTLTRANITPPGR